MKPYSLNVLLAKVKAILKRCDVNHMATKPSQCNRIRIDYNYRQVIVNETPIKLKNMEFKLLSYLMENANKVISKEELFEKIWESRFIEDGTLSVHIRRLRKIVEKDPDSPEYIKTIWGVGYVFEVSE